jgi:fucose permease
MYVNIYIHMQISYIFLTPIEVLIMITILFIPFPAAMEHSSNNYDSKPHKDPFDDTSFKRINSFSVLSKLFKLKNYRKITSEINAVIKKSD